MTAKEFLAGTRIIDDLGVVIHPADTARLVRAAELAASHSLRTYDALFIELARELQMPFITADKRLSKAAQDLVEIVLLDGLG